MNVVASENKLECNIVSKQSSIASQELQVQYSRVWTKTNLKTSVLVVEKRMKYSKQESIGIVANRNRYDCLFSPHMQLSTSHVDDEYWILVYDIIISWWVNTMHCILSWGKHDARTVARAHDLRGLVIRAVFVLTTNCRMTSGDKRW